MRFVTTLYGADYAPFLLPHLYSITNAYPDVSITLLWSDLPNAERTIVETVFPNCTLLHAKSQASKIEPSLSGVDEVHRRIARKEEQWSQACHLYPNELLVFVDCDMLVVKPFDDLLANDFDVAYTWKQGQFPVNTGFLAVRTGAVGAKFFEHWLEIMNSLLADETVLAAAVEESGAVDQHAFRLIVGFAAYEQQRTRTIDSQPIRFLGIPCQFLNETNCVPISEVTRIIHYKSGWHPILLRGAGFTQNRPQEKCEEMFTHWQQTESQASEMAMKAFVLTAAAKHKMQFEQILTSYEERGILHSEMLMICAVCASLNIDVIIESGRCRGQSTLMMGRFFEDSATKIISVELERDENAPIAEQRLSSYSNVRLLYGDSLDLIPKLVKQNQDKRIALLLDGPKGLTAVQLIEQVMNQSSDVVVSFLHDTKQTSIARNEVLARFNRVFFTDNREYVQQFSYLDETCKPALDSPITIHTWEPYKKGGEPMISYGPTIGMMLAGQTKASNSRAQQESKPYSRRLVKLVKQIGKRLKSAIVKST